MAALLFFSKKTSVAWKMIDVLDTVETWPKLSLARTACAGTLCPTGNAILLLSKIYIVCKAEDMICKNGFGTVTH